MTHRCDRGSAAVLMVGLIGVALSMMMHVAHVGRATVRAATAQSIADATALAGVVGSHRAAEMLARANAATLIEFDVQDADPSDGSVVHVIIAFEGRRASAWASDAG